MKTEPQCYKIIQNTTRMWKCSIGILYQSYWIRHRGIRPTYSSHFSIWYRLGCRFSGMSMLLNFIARMDCVRFLFTSCEYLKWTNSHFMLIIFQHWHCHIISVHFWNGIEIHEHMVLFDNMESYYLILHMKRYQIEYNECGNEQTCVKLPIHCDQCCCRRSYFFFSIDQIRYRAHWYDTIQYNLNIDLVVSIYILL